MRRALAAAALLVGVAAAPASAAPFGELPFRPVSSAAVCLAPTGTPGELTRWAPGGAEVLRATPAGLVPQATVALGELSSCPEAATDEGGAGVVAGTNLEEVRIAVREPGQGWGAPLVIPAKLARSVAVATSPRGDAVVAWTELEPRSLSGHVRLVRRVAGGAFGAPVRLAQSFELPSVRTGVTADGAAMLVITDRRRVLLAEAAPGAPFGAPRTLVRGGDYGGAAALAVRPDGRALLAVDLGNGLAVFDRDPGGEFVQRPTLPWDGGGLAVALGSDGTAVVATESGDYVSAVMRDGVGAFGAPINLSVPSRPRSDYLGFLALVGDDGAPPIETATPLRVALGADRRALLTWGVEGRGLRAATLTAGGSDELVPLASPLRDPLGATPIVLDDGLRAVAWTDDNDLFSAPPYAGRLHYAVEGAAGTPDPPAPTLEVGAPRDRSLRPAQALEVPVRCSAACDLRASLPKNPEQRTVSLDRAGTTLLRMRPFERALAPASGTLDLSLTWSAPGAPTAEHRTVRLRLRRLPTPPFPRIVDARAVHGPGGVVDVRWSTDAPAQDAVFYVYGSRLRKYRNDRDLRLGVATGGGRRAFHVRLRDAARVRYVRIVIFQAVGGRSRTVTINVRSRA